MHGVIGSLSFSPHRGEGAKKDGKGSGQHMEHETCEGQKQHVNSTLVLQHVKIREAGDKNRTFNSVVLDTHSSTGYTSTCGEGDRERGGVGLDKVGKVKLGQMQSWQPCHM